MEVFIFTSLTKNYVGMYLLAWFFMYFSNYYECNLDVYEKEF